MKPEQSCIIGCQILLTPTSYSDKIMISRLIVREVTMQFDYALLSNKGEFTIFHYGDYVIRFKSPYSLEKYTEIKEWDRGYLVVMAKYKHNKESEEEYIDLVPILEKLYITPDEFLRPIKGVKIENA